MITEHGLKQIARLVAAFKDTDVGELPATPEQLNECVVKLARKCLDGKSPHEALDTLVQRLTTKDTFLLRLLALDLWLALERKPSTRLRHPKRDVISF